MELTVLGSGTVAPSATRTAPAHWIAAGGVRLLMDCGAGTLHRAAAFGIPWPDVTHVAVSHFHLDHWGELPHLLFALRYGTEPARRAPLEILGPAGFATRMTLLASAYGDWVTDPGYPVRLREIEPGSATALAEGVTLEACATPHTRESLAFGVRHEGRRLVYTGDTGPSAELAEWAAGCDLLLCECSLPDDRAIELHLTPSQAGRLGASAGAKRLVLTHFYPQVEGTDPAGVAAREFGGDVVAAADGDRFRL